MFEGEAGQLVLADLIRTFGATHATMMPDTGDLGVLAYREGSRNVLVHINKRLDQDPEQAEAVEGMTSYV